MIPGTVTYTLHDFGHDLPNLVYSFLSKDSNITVRTIQAQSTDLGKQNVLNNVSYNENCTLITIILWSPKQT